MCADLIDLYDQPMETFFLIGTKVMMLCGIAAVAIAFFPYSLVLAWPAHIIWKTS